MCGWCLVGDHGNHKAGGQESSGGKAWSCHCPECDR